MKNFLAFKLYSQICFDYLKIMHQIIFNQLTFFYFYFQISDDLFSGLNFSSSNSSTQLHTNSANSAKGFIVYFIIFMSKACFYLIV